MENKQDGTYLLASFGNALPTIGAKIHNFTRIEFRILFIQNNFTWRNCGDGWQCWDVWHLQSFLNKCWNYYFWKIKSMQHQFYLSHVLIYSKAFYHVWVWRFFHNWAKHMSSIPESLKTMNFLQKKLYCK